MHTFVFFYLTFLNFLNGLDSLRETIMLAKKPVGKKNRKKNLKQYELL